VGRGAQRRGKVDDGRAKNSARRGHGSLKVAVGAGFEARPADVFSHGVPVKKTPFRFLTISKSTGHAPWLKTGADTQ